MLRFRILSENLRMYKKSMCHIVFATALAILVKYFLLLASVYIDKITVKDSEIDIPIYIINLDRAKDRMFFSENIMSLYGIKYTRFSAIDFNEITIQDNSNNEQISVNELLETNRKNRLYTASCFRYPDIEIKIHKKYYNHGEIGCLFSHVAAWNEANKKRYDRVLIFEDDFIFKPFFRNRLKTFLKLLPQKYEIAFLGYWSNYPLSSFTIDNDNIKDANGLFMSCLHAYIVNLKDSKLINIFKNVYNTITIDIEINAIIQSGIISAFLSNKSFVAQNKSLDSSINLLNKTRYQSITDYNLYIKNVEYFLKSNASESVR